MQDNNDPKIPDDGVLGFATPEEIDAFLYNNMNITQGSLLFNIQEPNVTMGETMRTVHYTIQVNTSDSFGKL